MEYTQVNTRLGEFCNLTVNLWTHGIRPTIEASALGSKTPALGDKLR